MAREGRALNAIQRQLGHYNLGVTWVCLRASTPPRSWPAVGQQPTLPWQSYQDDGKGGEVVYGGKSLGAAPGNSGEGWTSETFSGWLK